ncbi:MAG TPA: rhodanese-like domain-containing protein [Armatimonadaceae bacterium]|jgi:hydroxyacylglutathione hydrolase|nr:rhodanese-like domain-containing protein [Armatimonadaceae bacterium]
MEYKDLTPEEVEETLRADPAVFLLDVRTPREYVCHRIPGAVLIPIQELSCRLPELDPARPTICICEHGVRSEAAAELLIHHDFADVANMRGGMVRWRGERERG